MVSLPKWSLYTEDQLCRWFCPKDGSTIEMVSPKERGIPFVYSWAIFFIFPFFYQWSSSPWCNWSFIWLFYLRGRGLQGAPTDRSLRRPITPLRDISVQSVYPLESFPLPRSKMVPCSQMVRLQRWSLKPPLTRWSLSGRNSCMGKNIRKHARNKYE